MDVKYFVYRNIPKKDLPKYITEEMIDKLADKDGIRFNSLLSETSDFLDNCCNKVCYKVGYTEEKIQKMSLLQNEIDFNQKIFLFLDKYKLEPCSKEEYDLCYYKLEKEIKNLLSYSS